MPQCCFSIVYDDVIAKPGGKVYVFTDAGHFSYKSKGHVL